MISNDEDDEERRGHKELQKLQLMLRNLEEHNDLPSPDKNRIEHLLLNDNEDGQISNVREENLQDSYYKTINDSSEANENCNTSLLEYDTAILNIDEDISLDDENNWLLDSPVKSPKKPQLWLFQDIKTPNLTRVKGTLASKLDLISIQNRKEKLSQLLWKHNQGSEPESAPGRLYQAESMCSVMSLDWEYDEDEICLAFSSPIGRPATASDYYQMTDFDEIDSRQVNYGSSKKAASYTDPYKPRRFKEDVIADFDDLQPMSLDFESPPLVRRSVQVAPGPVITRRAAPFVKRSSPDEAERAGDLTAKPTAGVKVRGNRLQYDKSDAFEFGVNPSYRHSSLSDNSDSSGDMQISPRDSVSSSRSSLMSAEDIGQKNFRNKTTKGRRRLLPIASFFKHSIEEEEDDDYSTTLSSLNKQNLYFQRNFPQKTSKNNSLPKKMRIPSTPNNLDDGNLVVKLPTSSKDGPLIRRRGANPRSNSDDNIPRIRRTEDNNRQHYTSSSVKNGTSLVKSSAPVLRRSMPTPRGIDSSSKYIQSPDILPRRARSPEARSQSPDVIPRRSLGVVPRGSTSSKKN